MSCKLFKDLNEEIFHIGKSMYPFIMDMDTYQVNPYGNSEIQSGDVIVFILPGSNRKVTHRIISFNPQGIRTRGDNNWNADAWMLTPQDILGKVTHVQRLNKQFRIYGGRVGQLLATALRVKILVSHLIHSKASFLLSPAYHWLAQTGIFKCWMPDCITPQIFSFNSSDGTELQLLIGRRVIGHRRPAQTQWQIRRPFRLIIDASSLP